MTLEFFSQFSPTSDSKPVDFHESSLCAQTVAEKGEREIVPCPRVAAERMRFKSEK